MNVLSEASGFEALVQTLAPRSRLLRTWPLHGGSSAQMTALTFVRPDSETQTVIVRRIGERALQQNPQAAENEFRLLQLTQALGLATPAPLHLDVSGAIFPTPYLVIAHIEGRPEFAPSPNDDFTRQLAIQLANIHRATGAALDAAFLPKQATGYDAIVGKRPAHVDASLDEGRIRATLERAWPLPQRNAPALLHGDFWPGNILWRDGQLVAVIDWEDAQLGEPLTDLAMSRLDMLWIFGSDAMHAFTQQYQALMELDYANLPYWDLYAALRLVRLAGADLTAWAAFFAPFGRPDITEQTIRAHYARFVAQASAKL